MAPRHLLRCCFAWQTSCELTRTAGHAGGQVGDAEPGGMKIAAGAQPSAQLARSAMGEDSGHDAQARPCSQSVRGIA